MPAPEWGTGGFRLFVVFLSAIFRIYPLHRADVSDP